MKSQFKLYDIADMLRQALDAACEATNEETGELPEDWSEFIEAVQMERDAKLSQCALMARELKAEQEAVSAEAARISARSRAIKAQYERLREYIAFNMQAGEKIKNPSVSISCTERESVSVVNVDIVPDYYCRITRDANKREITKSLKEGEPIPGVEMVRNKSITIR